MAKIVKPEEQVVRLRAALESADRQLDLVLESRDEYGYAATVCLAARRRLRAGLKDCGLLELEPPADPSLNKKPDIVESIKWYRRK